MRSNLAGPFISALLGKHRRSLRWAADAAGVNHSALSDRLRGARSGVGTDALAAIVSALGEPIEQVQAARDLDAIDRGALPLDEQTTPVELRAARAAILAQREGA